METFALISGVVACIATTYNYILHNIAYEKIEYNEQSTENTDPWRWRKPNPDLGVMFGANILYDGDQPLTLKDGDSISSLIPRSRFNIAEPLVHLIGFCLLGWGMFLLLSVIIRQPAEGIVLLVITCLFLLGIGWLLIGIGNQIRRIDLYPDRLEVITKYAFFLYRRRCYHPHKRLKVKGQYQSLLGMERTQREPDYKLMITKPWLGFFPIQRQFLITCNKTQGSWIVGGLEHWNITALASDNPQGQST